jgi:hypothetical protein
MLTPPLNTIDHRKEHMGALKFIVHILEQAL